VSSTIESADFTPPKSHNPAWPYVVLSAPGEPPRIVSYFGGLRITIRADDEADR